MLANDGKAWAATGDQPLRYMTWGFGCGVITKFWNPDNTGSGDSWQVADAQKPLQQWKDYMLHVSGLNVKGAASHGNGNISVLTSTQSAREQGPLTATIDQQIADGFAPFNLPMRSLEVSISDNQDDRTLGHLYYSHNGINSPNRTESDPAKVFDRLFGGGAPSNDANPADLERANQIRNLKKSVLDFVHDDAKRLQADLPARERPRLQQHLDAIRDLEKEIDRLAENQENRTCEVPNRPGSVNKTPTTFEGSKDLNGPMSKLVALAWACDITRVVTYQTTQPASRASWNSGGISSWHGASHDGTENGKNRFHKGVVEHMRWLATLVDELHKTPDGDGNLLDNSVIMTVNDVGQGFTHQSTEMPTLLLGKAGGNLKTNRSYRLDDWSGPLLLTIAKSVGVTIPEVGRADLGNEDFLRQFYNPYQDPIGELLA